MICIQPPQSRYFETVWLVLRPDYKKERDRDMIREAGRILADSEKNIAPQKRKSPAGKVGGRMLFFVGGGCGAALSSLLWLLLTLLL